MWFFELLHLPHNETKFKENPTMQILAIYTACFHRARFKLFQSKTTEPEHDKCAFELAYIHPTNGRIYVGHFRVKLLLNTWVWGRYGNLWWPWQRYIWWPLYGHFRSSGPTHKNQGEGGGVINFHSNFASLSQVSLCWARTLFVSED